MMSICLNCKNNTKNLDSKVLKIKKVEQWYHQNVLYAVVESQDL